MGTDRPGDYAADDLSISGLARAVNDLAERARTKQLKPDEVTGGTFTITIPESWRMFARNYQSTTGGHPRHRQD